MIASIPEDKSISIPILQQIFTLIRRINEDAIVVVNQDCFSIRALNASKSTLPIITFRRDFFHPFTFDEQLEDDNSQIVAQVSTTALTMAFKNAKNPKSGSLRIDIANPIYSQTQHHPYDKTFVISLIDIYNINHIWEFPMSSAQVINALFDGQHCLAELKCHVSIFDGLSEAFLNQNTIYLDVNVHHSEQSADETQLLTFKSAPAHASNDATDPISTVSSLEFYKNDKCQLTSFDPDEIDESGIIQISFFLFDFIIGLKIAKILNQFVTIRILGPGQPMVLSSRTPDKIDFTMPVSTFNEDEDEDDQEQENAETISDMKNTSIDSDGRDDIDLPIDNNNNTQASQVSPWSFHDSKVSVKSEPVSDSKNVQFDSSQSLAGSYGNLKNSQNRASSLYQESPPWPPRRRVTGSDQVAQASQPQSDEEEDSV